MAHKRRLSVFIASMFLSSTLLSACAVSASPDPVADVAPAQEQADFATCVVTLQQKAKAAGISQQIIDTTVANLKYVPRVIELDNQQPEFTTTFGDYFDKRVTAWRVEQGKKMLAEHKSLLAKLTKEYGVPGQYIVAFWGLETNFGSYKGSMPVLDSLATLACDPRRSDYFTGELLQALTLKQQYNFADSKMVGSWAGAMGHTQFMPTNYRKYAVDGDGVADLWNSTDDALTSAANFLQHLGWKADERWGREVLIPSDYSFAYLGGKHPLPLVYAISVGHLADRINGGAVLTRAVPKQPRLSRETVKQIQQKLNDAGFDVGKPDGILGRNSVLGLQAFQHEKGLIADGFPDVETFTALGIKL